MRRVFTPGYVVYLVVLLAGATRAYRALAPRFRPLTIEDMASPDYRDRPDRLMRKIDRDGLLHDLRPHAKATHDGISYATNNDGLRESYDYALEKPPGLRRVILLGDSFVFGWGLRLEHTMSHQLASLLDRSRWEVLNFGVPAYNAVNEVQFFEKRGLKYHPDVVVLMYHPNDAFVPASTALGNPQATVDMLAAYYDGTATGDARARVEAFLRSQGQPLAPDWNSPTLQARDRQYYFHAFLPVYWSQVQAAFARLASLAREHGFTVMGVILPELDRPWEDHPFAPLYEHVHTEMARHGFEVVDLYPLLTRYPNTDLMLWGHDGHTGAFANRIIAHVLAERLTAG
ncbi:MAG TPA: GDSL-type esterase/lipase family protein [Candidatus Limnocylindria bacterium]|nr:GDSL-type esterase/lipase family protein [Candidatus Limnocylindria bacterium]